MVEIRRLTMREYPAAVKLADKVFRDESQKSMGDAFLSVFSPSLGQAFGAFADGELVSFMGLVPAVIHIGEARLKVYSLGSVCTDEDYRGQGLASNLLDRVLAHVDKAGASLLLVSGDRPLYTRVHCHPFGEVDEFLLTRRENFLPGDDKNSIGVNEKKGVGEYQIRELQATDWLALHELAQARPVRFEQSVWDLAGMVHSEPFASCIHRTHRTWVAEQDGQPVAFAVLGLPYRDRRDLSPLVIEWAGPAEAVGAILKFAVETQVNSLTLVLGPHEQEIAAVLSLIPAKRQRNQGTVRVMEAGRLVQQLRPYLIARDSHLATEFVAVSMPDGQVEVRLGEEMRVLSSQQFIAFVFDSPPQTVWTDKMESLRRRLFPVAFPYTAGLNYV